MNAFPIIPAALTGFRLTREQPRALLLWAGVALAIGLVDAAVFAATGAQGAANRLQALQTAGSTDVLAMLSLLPRLAPALLVSFVLSFGMGAVLLASVFRAELSGERRVRIGLGREEGRVLLALLTLLGVQVGVELAMTVLLAFIALAAGSGASASALASVAMLLSLAVNAVLMVRLALLPAMAVSEGRVDLAEAWRRTRGRFWPLLGALAAAAAFAMVVTALAGFAFEKLAGAALLAGGVRLGALKTVFIPADTGLRALLAPGVIAAKVFGAVLVALVLPILAGPVAAASRLFPRAVETSATRT